MIEYTSIGDDGSKSAILNADGIRFQNVKSCNHDVSMKHINMKEETI